MVESLFTDSTCRTTASEPSVFLSDDSVDNTSQAGTTFEDDEDIHGNDSDTSKTPMAAVSDHSGSVFSRQSSLLPVFPEDMTPAMQTASIDVDERLRVLSISPLGTEQDGTAGITSSQSLVSALQDLSRDVQSLRFEMYALHTDVNTVLDATASAAEAAKASAEHVHCQQRNNCGAAGRAPVTINVISSGLSDAAGPCDCCCKEQLRRDREAATYYPRFQ